jgi:ATP-dependent helicase/nuclease subunit B
MKLTVLLVPSRAAALEIPRRLATVTQRAVAGLLPMKLSDLARAIAEPGLLGRGLRAWDSGHGALLAARIASETPGGPMSDRVPLAPVARVAARTFAELREAGVPPVLLARLPAAAEGDDRLRLDWLSRLYQAFDDAVEGRFADPATFLRAAAADVGRCSWLAHAEVLVCGELELSPLEQSLLSALARARPVRRLETPYPPALRLGTFGAWAAAESIATVEPAATVLAPVFPAVTDPALRRLREALFESPQGEDLSGGAVELLTAPGEAAEVRAVARRLLREAARGMAFEDMGVLLARPDPYARLFTDLLARLRIPHRLHPSLPLRYGRSARSLLLLFRCRGLRRSEVLELLTFAPIPFADRLGPGVVPRVAQWDQLSRAADIVSGLDRWEKGTTAVAREAEREADLEEDEGRRERLLLRAADARALYRLVQALDQTLSELEGEATWDEWAHRLRRVLDRWIAPVTGAAAERTAVAEMIQALAGLGFATPTARWADVESVLEARLEWERLPLEPLAAGGVHVGTIDALAGLPFRFVAVPGLVEGGFPGVLRPDPLLLDHERRALAASALPGSPPRAAATGQLSLFDEPPAAVPPPPRGVLPTTQDRLLEARRAFHLAMSLATERLALSYPRADPRSGRERLPSLFFVAAASALCGRSVGAEDLARLVTEDGEETRPIEDALDASERDRDRVRAGGREAALAIAAGSRFFQQCHLASHARWSSSYTAYDGLVAGPGVTPEIAARLDPATSEHPISASRLATYAQCGFRYLLQHVLRLEAAPEPEERTRLDPLERGRLFHDVAERFLRERRDAGALPVRDTDEERARLGELGDNRLDALVEGAPPRFTLLWQRERARFHDGLRQWLAREARQADSVPMHFEVGFGLRRPPENGEAYLPEPLVVELGNGRALRVSGKIDRIDGRPDGALVIRDYKTGRAPKNDAGLFRGGRQLQIPFYVLAAARLFPDRTVAQAFLDYVDGGRRADFDLPSVTGEGFRSTLRQITTLIAQGTFVQEPSACEWCDFKSVCGPVRLIERRRSYKIGDRRVQAYLRLRDIP